MLKMVNMVLFYFQTSTVCMPVSIISDQPHTNSDECYHSTASKRSVHKYMIRNSNIPFCVTIIYDVTIHYLILIFRLRKESRTLATVPLLQKCVCKEKCHVLRGRRFTENKYALFNCMFY